MDSEKPAAIRLSGENILEEHCTFDNTDGKVLLYAMLNSVTVGVHVALLCVACSHVFNSS